MKEQDLAELASLCARAIHNGRRLFPNFERPDRVFMARAVEHVLARRLLHSSFDLSSVPADKVIMTKELLERIADEDWVQFRYGDRSLTPDRGGETDQVKQRSEQVARISLAAVYDFDAEPDPGRLRIIRNVLDAGPFKNRPRIVDTLLSGPNLFLPLGDASRLLDGDGQERARRMRELILAVTRQGNRWNWRERAQVLDAVVRVLDNAIKFSPAHGIVTIAGDTVGDFLRITVTDTGIGIRPEDLPLVVRPFHRRKPAFEASQQGVGLGLPFAKTMFELHGGSLAIHSTQGIGTTVTIELPLAVDAALHDAA
jgi:hypothetical protein